MVMPDPSESKRIQLRRTKGWRKPEGAVVVDRRTIYGNPWRPQDAAGYDIPKDQRQAWAVRQYRRELYERGGTGELEFVTIDQLRERLRGKDLACWCPLEDENGNRVPCHADVLLEIAAGGDE